MRLENDECVGIPHVVKEGRQVVRRIVTAAGSGCKRG